MRRNSWWMGSLLAVTALCPAWGQEENVAPPAAGQPAVQETAKLADQIAVLRAINPLRLSAEQVQALLDVLRPALQKTEQLDATTARQWSAVTPQLRQATAQAAAAPAQLTPAETEYNRLQMNARSASNRARAQARNDVRALLEKSLTPQQKNVLLTAGRTVYLQQRLGEGRGDDRSAVEQEARQLDQLRQADPRRFQEERQQFAMRQSDVMRSLFQAAGGREQFREQFRGQRGDGGERGPGGERGDRGWRGDRGGLPPQIQEQLRQPQYQAQLAPYLAIADQVRRMPEPMYQQQRLKLALQIWQAREERRLQSNPERGMEAFISQYLVTPAAVEVLEAKLARAGTG